ncbi:MAG: acetate--CoA ligase family protein [Acidisphaera sp.]|nr:acetate--CoA ligase family protein [Acidisphaera sp.]
MQVAAWRCVAPTHLDRFFAPRSLAIVGASDEAYWSRNAYANLPAIGFSGRVVPVNPKRARVFGLDCIPTLRQLDSPVDLAYIAAPPGAISAVLEDAGAAGVRNAVIIAAGFSESGDAGRQLQRSLVDQARRHGITVLGPNCPGFLNVTDSVAAYGQQIPLGIPRGGVGVVLQSGALTTVMLKFSIAHAIGLSKVICLGNEAMIQAADVLEYLIADPATRVIAMFLEQIREGGRFLALADRALLCGKAIVVLKAGRTPAGQKAALAHTGAVAGDEAVVDAALRQAGIVRVRSLEELLITAGLLAQGYSLGGGRMAVVSASGGACDIIADRASDEGLALPAFSVETRAELQAYLPKFATVQNPLDTAAIDTVRETGTAAVPMDVVAEMVSRDPGFDFVLYMGFNVVPQIEPEPGERDRNIARMELVRDMRCRAPLPVVPIGLTCLEAGPFAKRIYADNGIWMLPGIEFGLTALGHAVHWNAARQDAEPRARAVHSRPKPFAGAGKQGTWSEAEGRRLLESAGVPLVPATLATSAKEAVAAAERFGYPVVLKVCAAEIAHKSDIGGVKLNLGSAAEVGEAYAAVRAAGLKAARNGIEGVLVVPMRPPGVELLAGVTVDSTFGPTLAVGLGGIWVETLRDVSLAVLPVSPPIIERMLESLRAKPILEGARGGPRIDLARAADAIWRCSQAALSLGDDLQALEVNPLWCRNDRVEALDALVITGR